VSYDEALAARVRGILSRRTDVVEKKMFGGLCFLVGGHMCCGLASADLMVRVGPAQYEDALARPYARPMDFTGRPLAGMVYVAPAGLRSIAALTKWVELGVRFVSSLPAKKVAARSANAEARVAAAMRAFRSNPRLVAVVEALEADRQAGSTTRLGRHGLTVNGRLFARFVEGTLVVKLTENRIARLVAAGLGSRCDGERGRLRRWFKVTSPKASWVGLAKEARDLAKRG
jgi:TfoX/Sxy family transcriptional regulator of competence genes